MEFAEKTGIDRFAGAYGNSHGISLDEPELDVERIKAVRYALPERVAMVLHGGSGIPDSEIRGGNKGGNLQYPREYGNKNGLRGSFAEIFGGKSGGNHAV